LEYDVYTHGGVIINVTYHKYTSLFCKLW